MATTPLPSAVAGGVTWAADQRRPWLLAFLDRQPRTLRAYYLTLFWTIAAVVACGAGYVIEKYLFLKLFHWITAVEYRLFKNPAELPMRIFGLPHFVIGTAFLLSSRRMKGAVSWGRLAVLTALGIAFCWLFFEYGRMPVDEAHPDAPREFSPLALLVFYFYFLIHGFRDEAFFYKAYGDMPKDAGPAHERIMVVLQLLMLGLLLSLLIPAYQLYGEFNPKFKHPAIEAIFPASWPYAVRFLSFIVPMTLIAIFALWRIALQFENGLAGLWKMHRPILTVFLIGTGIILVALVSGPWTFNLVVLMHFVGWYLFGRHSLASRPPTTPVQPWTWQWCRTTRTGFTVLHLGLAGIVVALLAVSTYVFGKQDGIETIMGSKTFFYWTIMHVTLSFFPR